VAPVPVVPVVPVDALTVPITTVSPSFRPEVIWVPWSPTMPSLTVTVDVLPLLTTFTVEVPLAVVMADAGTYSAFEADDLVVIDTLAVWPRRSPDGIESSVMVVG
jgi:hypothetical protein